jgi:hypothetical protein
MISMRTVYRAPTTFLASRWVASLKIFSIDMVKQEYKAGARRKNSSNGPRPTTTGAGHAEYMWPGKPAGNCPPALARMVSRELRVPVLVPEAIEAVCPDPGR